MPLRAHVTLPFDRLAGELNLPMRGVIPSGTFLTLRSQPALGWDEAGRPVPELTARRARLLYNRGFIGPAPVDPSAAEKPPARQPKRKRG